MLGILDIGCIAMHYKQYSQTGCDISPLMKIIQSVTYTYWLVSELDLILEEQGKSIDHQSKIHIGVFAKQ
jgi:hypothetical protein